MPSRDDITIKLMPPRNGRTGKIPAGIRGLKLCYVTGCFAYFTDATPRDVTGDDWNDSPADANASIPYSGFTKMIVVAFDGPWEARGPQAYSADALNRREYAWLEDPGYGLPTWPDPVAQIFAGTQLNAFVRQIERRGGSVYFRQSDYNEGGRA